MVPFVTLLLFLFAKYYVFHSIFLFLNILFYLKLREGRKLDRRTFLEWLALFVAAVLLNCGGQRGLRGLSAAAGESGREAVSYGSGCHSGKFRTGGKCEGGKLCVPDTAVSLCLSDSAGIWNLVCVLQENGMHGQTEAVADNSAGLHPPALPAEMQTAYVVRTEMREAFEQQFAEGEAPVLGFENDKLAVYIGSRNYVNL